MSTLRKLAIGTAVACSTILAAKYIFRYKQVKDLKGKSALVTGAANGLGRCICVELAQQKEITEIVLWDIQKEALEETARILQKINPNLKIHQNKINLADKQQIYSTAEAVIQTLGGKSPYLIVNNAGVVSGSDGILNTSDERIELELKINTLAHVYITKAFLPRMISTREGGHFLNITSAAAYIAAGDLVAYAMSKKGAKGFAEGLLAQLKLEGNDKLVKVTCLCPAHILTKLFEGFTDGQTPSMTPEFVARESIKAVKQNRESLLLPYSAKHLPSVIGIFEAMGYLNLPMTRDLAPMKAWKSKQTDMLYDKIKSANL